MGTDKKKEEKTEKRSQIRISVRNLVEFILREGDIDNRHGQSVSPEAMLAGSRMHRKIQKRKGSDYHAEVPLKLVLEEEYYDLILEGRADGIQILTEGEKPDYSVSFQNIVLEDSAKVIIDEIKGIYMKLDRLLAPVGVHIAQAKCYAYIYALQHELKCIGVQMTYVNLDTEEMKYFSEEYTFEALKEWFDDLIASYRKWSDFQYAWKKLRQESIQKLQFPFAYRKGQKELAAGVYRTIQRKKNLFIQAPTGVGKTITTVFPAVKAVGEGLGDRIFYLTAKTVTGTVAWETFDQLRRQGYQAKLIQITAKEKMCLCAEMECNPVHCPYARGHYDRVNDAVFGLLQKEDFFTREVLLEQAREYQVCPFEMSLDVASWVDDIICDYNYVFDPNVYLKRFFAEGIRGDYIFLIDEAHNLVERGREMYSAGISRQSLVALRKKIRKRFSKLARTLDKANRQMMELEENLAETGKGYQVLPNPGVLPITFLTISGELEEILEEKELEEELRREILEFYFIVRDFLNVSELVDENYVVYTENNAEEGFRLRLFCVNPAENLGEYLKKGKSAIFFSATMFPMLYYRELLTTDRDAYGIYVQSPFPKENRRILIGSDVSSRYTRRNRAEYRKIAGYIARCVWQRQGNYMVFFPSYRLMEDVLQVYEEEFSVDWVRCVCQTPDMTEQEREGFLEEFQEREGTLVGFCVLGGIFSEGVDLTGESLIGAVIVGTGLPQIGSQREILKEYYDKKNHCGFDYAYRYPGMNKVLQAAGRVIRTKEDKGVILLLDDRFWDRDYQEIFPREWQDRTGCRLDTVEGAVETFWKRFT